MFGGGSVKHQPDFHLDAKLPAAEHVKTCLSLTEPYNVPKSLGVMITGHKISPLEVQDAH